MKRLLISNLLAVLLSIAAKGNSIGTLDVTDSPGSSSTTTTPDGQRSVVFNQFDLSGAGGTIDFGMFEQDLLGARLTTEGLKAADWSKISMEAQLWNGTPYAPGSTLVYTSGALSAYDHGSSGVEYTPGVDYALGGFDFTGVSGAPGVYYPALAFTALGDFRSVGSVSVPFSLSAGPGVLYVSDGVIETYDTFDPAYTGKLQYTVRGQSVPDGLNSGIALSCITLGLVFIRKQRQSTT